MEGRNEKGQLVKGYTLNKRLSLSFMKDEIIEMYLDGKMSIKEIAIKVGYSRYPIEWILKENNIEIRHPSSYLKGKSPPNKRYMPKEEIIELYNKNNSISAIAKLMKCDFSVIKRILKENNIEIRPQKDYIVGRVPANKKNIDKEVVIKMYLEQDISGVEIAKKFNCDSSVIYNILNKENVKIKGNSHFLKGRESPTKNKTYEEIYGEERAKELRKKAIDGTKKVMENADYRKLLSEIRLKGLKEGRIKVMKGKEHPFYGKPQSENQKKGIERYLSKTRNKTKEEVYGKEKAEEMKKKISATKQEIPLDKWEKFTSFEPYGIEFNNRFKKAIKERDGCCTLCNIGFEDLKLLKRRVHIHHINYDKRCNLPQNCITLCVKCHAQTNQNRKQWTPFFQSLLNEKYNYQYSDEDIILKVGDSK